MHGLVMHVVVQLNVKQRGSMSLIYEWGEGARGAFGREHGEGVEG